MLRVALIAIIAFEVIGFAIGGLFGPSGGAWYSLLEKPALNPPVWVFPVAWTLLYAMMGVAFAMVWTATDLVGRPAAGRITAIVLFFIQLALNYAWSPIFFGAKALDAAVVATLVLLFAVIAAAFAMGKVDRRSGFLMAPYVLWVGFALYLTIEIWVANPEYSVFATL
ncbi:MAG: TspO/MBR family protein [Pseudomonadota bacterium]